MAKLDDLIQQKQQRDEDWKAKKTAEREELVTDNLSCKHNDGF